MAESWSRIINITMRQFIREEAADIERKRIKLRLLYGDSKPFVDPPAPYVPPPEPTVLTGRCSYCDLESDGCAWYEGWSGGRRELCPECISTACMEE